MDSGCAPLRRPRSRIDVDDAVQDDRRQVRDVEVAISIRRRREREVVGEGRGGVAGSHVIVVDVPPATCELMLILTSVNGVFSTLTFTPPVASTVPAALQDPERTLTLAIVGAE